MAVDIKPHVRDPNDDTIVYGSVASGNTGVATVTIADGVVTILGVTAGTSTITVVIGDGTANITPNPTFTVEVISAQLSDITSTTTPVNVDTVLTSGTVTHNSNPLAIDLWQWQRCTAATGDNCGTDIGTDLASYTVDVNDIGGWIRLRVMVDINGATPLYSPNRIQVDNRDGTARLSGASVGQSK